MFLTHLSLTNFRNYTRLELDLPARVNVFQGENAQGKTNLLEAVYYLATTRSPLASHDRELIHWAAEREVIPHCQVDGAFTRAGAAHTLAYTLVKERANGAPAAQAVFRRQIRVDGVPRRAMDVVGQLNVVLFLPEDIRLVAGAPAERRRYLDITLCQVNAEYCHTLARYNRVIEQRNALLKAIRERQARPGELSYWDEQAAQLGAYVVAERLRAVAALAAEARRLQGALTAQQEALDLVYATPEWPTDVPTKTPVAAGPADPLAERLCAGLHAGLAAARAQEIARGVTLVGPHRDDLRFVLNGMDATVYASRGQQRTIALALKLAEVLYMRARAGQAPVLLLDDALSELDQRRAQLLLAAVADAEQVLITTTDLGHYDPDFLRRATLWRVAAGSVTPTA
ncbi:MAG: DNA replication/repair protein RecF [Chloroflexota bacterium]